MRIFSGARAHYTVYFNCALCVQFFVLEEIMEYRIAVLAIIVDQPDSVSELNNLLSEYGSYIFGRMGIPYREKGVQVLSVAIDAPQNVTSTLAGKIGKLPGISIKTAYSNVITYE